MLLLSSLDAEGLHENGRLEAKAAQGGLPRSVWPTYSAFANTDGGVILLGVKEVSGHRLVAAGVPDPDRVVKEFWDGVNNPSVVSENILGPSDVHVDESFGEKVVVIEVPRAERGSRPVHLHGNPFTGSYRRNGEGDYRCSADEVKSMLRDSEATGLDGDAVGGMGLDALSGETVEAYRLVLYAQRPAHPWLDLPIEDFLIRLGAARRVASDPELRPTRAGLLMFGWEHRIVEEFPSYFLDYRESLERQKWDDRLVSNDGEWSGNVFDFWRRVSARIVSDLPRPYETAGLSRVDDTPMHRSLREALANMLLHADYYGGVNCVSVRYDDRVTFMNPGIPLVSAEVAMAGGVSQARNPTLMKMFNLISIGERAGSGFDTMRRGTESMGLPEPALSFAFAPDRTMLEVSVPPLRRAIQEFTPEELLRELFRSQGKDDDRSVRYVVEEGDVFDDEPYLSAVARREDAVLELIDERGPVSRSEVAEALGVSRSTASNLLIGMARNGDLRVEGAGRSTRYARMSGSYEGNGERLSF